MKTGTNQALQTHPDLKQYAKQQARNARHQVRRAAVLVQNRRFTLTGIPVLFANSFPKSGTHLLSQILVGFTKIGPAVNCGLPVITTYSNITGQQHPVKEIVAAVKRLKPGDIGLGHLHAFPEIVNILCTSGYAAFFILRDPRDVVVSHVYYVTEMEPDQFHHDYYTYHLQSFDERLSTSILGLPDSQAPFPNIADRFAPFVDWLDHPEVLTLHFENLINDKVAEIRTIIEHAVQRGFPLQIPMDQAIQTLLSAIDPKRSPTFRSGKSGGWRDKFSAEHRSLFKQVAGDLLIQLGYEQDYDW